MKYLITLEVTPDEGDGEPDDWDWDKLVQTASKVVVVSCCPLTSTVVPYRRRRQGA